MKNLSRMKDEAELQDFCISELVDIVKPLVQSKLKHSSILLIEDFENFDVKSDKGEISQVLLNLIHNAADAIGGTEDKKWIKLSSFKKSGYVYLSVSDSGEGIPQDKISKIFQPFFTTKEVGEGTGLGLSLSKNIMTRNGGDLEYDSESLNTTFNMKMKNSDS
jgi:C4-dicarboxylate-specific signal transduction histidine kinase